MRGRSISSYAKKRIVQGHKLEESVFGFSPNLGPRDTFYRKIRFHEEVAATIRTQEKVRWNPKKPHTRLARSLFEAVKARLPYHLKEEIMLCCALGTPLDRIGVDGFFVLQRNLKCPVTFDLIRSGSECCWRRKGLKANGYISVDDMSCKENISRIGIAIALGLIKAVRRGRPSRKKLW